MNDISIPWGRNGNGDIVFPVEAEKGKLYKCFGCDSVNVFGVKGDWVTPHMRAVKGSVHTGTLCKHLNDRRCRTKPPRIDLVDKHNMVRNIMITPETKTPPEGGPRNPGSPRKEPERLVVCTSLPKIREHKLHLKEDFKLENGEMFSNTFVSAINAHTIMNDNASLGIRGLQVKPDYAFMERRAIRFIQKAKRYQNGKSTAAQKVLDIEFKTDEQFRIALNLLFIRNPDRSSKLRYLPRYKEVFVFGIWNGVMPNRCRWNGECKKLCASDWVHCTGRQVSEGINAMKQINVDDADLIHFDIMT